MSLLDYDARVWVKEVLSSMMYLYEAVYNGVQTDTVVRRSDTGESLEGCVVLFRDIPSSFLFHSQPCSPSSSVDTPVPPVLQRSASPPVLDLYHWINAIPSPPYHTELTNLAQTLPIPHTPTFIADEKNYLPPTPKTPQSKQAATRQQCQLPP